MTRESKIKYFRLQIFWRPPSSRVLKATGTYLITTHILISLNVHYSVHKNTPLDDTLDL
jgi:hypothetical protein